MIVTILLVVGILLYTMELFLFFVFGDNFLCFKIGLVMLVISVGTFIGLAIWAIGSYYSGGVL